MALSDTTIKLLDIAVKGGLGIVLTLLATLYGYKLNAQREREADSSKRVQAIVDLTTKQKDLDVQLAVQMFSTLTSNYFRRTPPRRTASSCTGRSSCCAWWP